jgi:hypothetical protein
MFMTTAFAPDRADLEDLILDAPEKVLFCRLAAATPGPEDVPEAPEDLDEEHKDDEDEDDEEDDDDEDDEEDDEDKEDEVESLAR